MMLKKTIRTVALVMSLIITLSLCTPVQITLFAHASKAEPQTVGAELDYDSLRASAYIVNPQWTSLRDGESLSYAFRGRTYNETYSASRHFKSFAAAYAYFESLYTDTSGNLKSGISTAVPVFILAPGTYTEPRMTVRYNAWILGANAGISPNAAINFDTADPRSGWAAASRCSESVVDSGFARSTRVNGSSSNLKYESAAVQDRSTQFGLIIDGVKFSGSEEFLSLADTSASAARTMDVDIQNSLISCSSSSYYVNSSLSTSNVNNIDFKSIRAVSSKTKGFVDQYCANAALDGVYFAQSSGSISNNASVARNYSFLMRNSYMYKCTAAYNLNFKYSSGDHKSTVTLEDNMFYEHNSGGYGALIFYTTKTSRNSSYRINIINNTFLADNTVNSSLKNTFLNGNKDYQTGAYTIYVNENRVIGYKSLFPNSTGDWTNNIVANYNYNYFAPTYSGYTDVLGTRSAYSSNTPYVDPIDIGKLVYYSDYAKTIYEGSMDVCGVSFFDDADYVSIDNKNSLITAMYTCGKIIYNPALYFKDSAATAEFYSDSDCSNTITSIQAPAQNATKTVYAKVTRAGVVNVVTVMLYNNADTVPAFSSAYTDPEGIINNTAYLLAPEVSSLANGASYTADWNGKSYSFKVGTNAFSSIDKIFTACGTSVPQIILPHGEYGALTLTKPCSLYGENYQSSAAAGSGNTDWGYGLSWNNGKSSKVTSISVTSGDITVSGIELCGAFTDTSRTSGGKITFKNSVVNATQRKVTGYRQFNVSNLAVSTTSCEYLIEGVYFAGVSKDSDGSRTLFGGDLPAVVTISGCYSNGSVTTIADSKWNNALYSGRCAFTVTDSRFDGILSAYPLLPDVRDSVATNGCELVYTVQNSIFTGTDSADGCVISLKPEAYSAIDVTDNTFINSVFGSASVLECDYADSNYSGGMNFTNNRIIGFSPFIKAKNLVQTDSVVDASYNYFAAYSEDFSDTGVCPQGYALCTQYYADYAMTRLKKPVSVEFTDKNGLSFDSEGALVEINIDSSVQSLDLSAGYILNPDGNEITCTDDGGSEIALQAIPTDGLITTLSLKVSVPGNSYLYSLYTLKIYKNIPTGTQISYITSDRGTVAFDDRTGGYVLTLPETSGSAAITVQTPDGASAALCYNGVQVSTVAGVTAGTSRIYTISVTNGAVCTVYPLTVVRNATETYPVDYTSCITSAYVIDPDWSATTGGSVSFTFRGTEYTQSFDPARHFASFDAAYTHWLASAPDIIHDTPVFIFTAGTYTDVNVRYRAILLGTNAGISPNDPSADISELTPEGDISSNSEWDSANETVISGTVRRTSRINANEDLSIERAIQQAENSADERMSFLLVADGISFTGAGSKVLTQDIDTGSRTDSTSTTPIAVSGRRQNDVYLQNISSASQSGYLFSGDDSSFNYNNLTVKSIRISGFNGRALFGKYIDLFVLDGAYITDSTMSISIFDVDSNMNMRHSIDYTIKNSCFINNRLTRTVRIRTTALSGGDYTVGSIRIYNNIFLETGSAEWGIISVSAALTDLDVTIRDNIFSQTGSYNSVRIRTAIEGNQEFFNNPMSMTVSGNRFIGIETYLPNLSSISDTNLERLSFDFNGNYLAPQFTGADDICGVVPEYINSPDGSVDPINLGSLEYFHDYRLKILSTDFDIENVLFNSQDTVFTADNSLRTISCVIMENTSAPLKFVTHGDGVEQTITLRGSRVPLENISYRDVLSGKTRYTLYLTKNSVTTTYFVTLSADETGLFSEVYSDPTGQISKSACIISTDVINLRRGTVTLIKWKGEYYRFVVGENAFPDIETLRAAKEGKIQAILPETVISGELRIPADTSVYGVNYDVNPNVRGADISDDWTLNPDWGRYGESKVGSIAIDADASGSDIVIKGVTLCGRFTDTQRKISSDKTSITLENICVNHEALLENSNYGYYSQVYTFTFSNANNVSASRSLDVGVMRNIRVEKVMCTTDINGGKNRLLNEYLPQDFTIDGLYCDMSASGVSMLGWWKLGQNQTNGKLSVLNCNIRNGIQTTSKTYLNFEGRNHVNNAAGQTAELNISGNCMYNTQTNNIGLEISLYAYSSINITDNLFLSNVSKTIGFIGFKDTTTAGSTAFNICGNRFVGVLNSFENPSNNAGISLSGNYYADYSADFTTQSSSKYLSGSNCTNDWYYKNYALSLRSDSLGGYRFGNGMVHNVSQNTLALTLGAGKSQFSLNDYIVQNSGNTITVAGVGDISRIPLRNTQYTVNVAKGTASESLTLTLTVNPTDMSALYSAISNANGYLETAGYREDAKNTLADTLVCGRRLTMSDSADSESVASAAAAINYAADRLVAYKALDDSLALAEACSTSGAESLRITIFKAALNNGKAVSENPDSSVADINSASAQINDAILGLSVNTQELSSALENAEQIMASPEYDYYTRSSCAALSTAYNTAYAVYTDTGSSAAQMLDALSALNTALDGLEPNVSKLTGAISSAQNITNTDKKYTKLSFDALTAALDEARALTSPTATQIMNSCNALNDARAALIDQSAYLTVLNSARSIDNSKDIYCKVTYDQLSAAVTSSLAAQDSFANAGDVADAQTALENAIAALKTHSFINYVDNNDATETKNGTQTAVCETPGCGKTDTREIPGTAITHSWDEGTVTTAPTCTTAGVRTYTCTTAGCGETKTEVIPILITAHSWDEGTVTTAPTCTTTGVRTYTCLNNPLHKKTETIPALGHDWDEGSVTTAPTCTTTGVRTFTCKNDPTHTKTEVIPVDATAHAWGEYVYNNDATLDRDGTKTRTCSICGETETITAEGTKIVLVNSNETFPDVETGKWYTKYVDYVVTLKLMKGTSDNEFEPSTNLTRAMFVQILANISGVDTTDRNVTTKFADVPSGKWFTPAVKWASENGIVNGLDDNNFGPSENIQRQQMCVMLVRFANFKQITLKETVAQTAFADDAQINNYARDAVYACEMAGIVNGVDAAGNFEPRGNATRSQISKIIAVFHQDYILGK